MTAPCRLTHLSGGYLAVGSPGYGNPILGLGNAGHVSVYQIVNTAGLFSATLKTSYSPLAHNGRFGTSIAPLWTASSQPHPDIAIGAPGQNQIWVLSAAGMVLYQYSVAGSSSIGMQMTSSGDTDADGYDDLIVSDGADVFILHSTPTGMTTRTKLLRNGFTWDGDLAGVGNWIGPQLHDAVFTVDTVIAGTGSVGFIIPQVYATNRRVGVPCHNAVSNAPSLDISGPAITGSSFQLTLTNNYQSGSNQLGQILVGFTAPTPISLPSSSCFAYLTLGPMALTIASAVFNPGQTINTMVTVPNDPALLWSNLLYQGFTIPSSSTTVLDVTDGVEIRIGY